MRNVAPWFIILFLLAFLILVMMAQSGAVTTQHELVCKAGEDNVLVCVSGGMQTEVETFEDGSFVITGCLSGALCED